MQVLKPDWVNHDGDKAIFSVDIHPDGSRFATGGQGQDSSGRVVIWNLRPVVSAEDEENDKIPKLLCLLDQHLGCVNSVRWSNSGRYLATAGDDKVIIIWQLSSYGGGAVFGSNVVNVESWRSVTTLRGHGGDILDVAWSPGDVWLASASVDNNVIIWNAAKWPEQVRVLRGHTGLVKGVTWDPVGKYIASQSDDRSLRVWHTSDWSTTEQITAPFSKCGGTTTILRPSWSPDGQYLVSAHAMNNGGPTAQIIDRVGWTTDKDFVGHRKAITCVRFNPNILSKNDKKTGKAVQYSCVAIGSRDRSISIWFTSLKRPLVVLHELFDDSVLDLSWSKCGHYLMSVSKDGTLAFVHFGENEIGTCLTEDETNNVHIKLYGKSVATAVASVNSTIIENPELLQLQEQHKSKTLLQASERSLSNTSFGERRPGCSAASIKAPTDKQIEMRTVDGRRRITPMFIPPPAEGETTTKSESGFSSSRQEKSKIVVEKVDGVVEPNISSPNKLTGSLSNQGTTSDKPNTLPPPAELESVPVGLSARLENRSSVPASTTTTTTTAAATSPTKGNDGFSSPVPSKRKFEDAQPISVKRRRGRPPVYERPSAPSSRPPTPPPTTTVNPTPPLISKKVESVHVLPEATISRSARIQIPGVTVVDGLTPMVVVENDWRVGDKISGSSSNMPSLHRVSRSQGGETMWVSFHTSPVCAATTTEASVAVACHDKSLHIIDINTGELLLPPLQLHGRPSKLTVQQGCIIILTTDATLSIYHIEKKKRVMAESIRHLVEGKSGGVKGVQLASQEDKDNDCTPVVLLTSGEAFTRCPQLETWIQLGENPAVRRAIQPEYTMLQPCQPTQQSSRPLTSILLQTAAYSGTTRVTRPIASDDVKQGLTESFIQRMLSSSKYLKSPHDYKFWLRRLVKFYIKEAMEKKLRKMFNELLGPVHSGSTNLEKSSWDSKLMGMDKRNMLEEFLKEILLAENSLQLQRLYGEYKEQLDGLQVFSI